MTLIAILGYRLLFFNAFLSSQVSKPWPHFLILTVDTKVRISEESKNFKNMDNLIAEINGLKVKGHVRSAYDIMHVEVTFSQHDACSWATNRII